MALHPPADVDQRLQCSRVEARDLAALLGYLPPNGAAAASSGTYSTSFACTCSRTTSRVTLLTRKSSGVTSPPTTASPRPQLALIATMLGSPLTGLQVNITPGDLGVDHLLDRDAHRRLAGRSPSRAR